MPYLVSRDVEERTLHFYDWEIRGRGWARYPERVVLEPPFRPFLWHGGPAERVDDGRRPTALSSLVERFFGGGATATEEPMEEEPEEPAPEQADTPRDLDEHLVLLPPDARIGTRETTAWLQALRASREPVAFELVAHASEINVRLATRRAESESVLGSLRAYFPRAVVRRALTLEELWATIGRYGVIVEFGLWREFMAPLATFGGFSPDPLTDLLSALATVGAEELAVFQVLFEGTHAPWEENVIRAVTTPAGDPFFLDAPELTAQARGKVEAPLFAVVLRLGVSADNDERAWQLLSRISSGLTAFGSPLSNELVPLSGEGFDELEADLLSRMSHRSGMLFSRDELAGLVHLPSEAVTLPELLRSRERTKRPPEPCLGPGIALGENEHLDEVVPVRLPESVRLKHAYVVGASGTGKSTLLAKMILEDLERGAGVGVIDPHGDLVDEVLSRLPRERLEDAVLLDPAAEDFAVGWNLLGAGSEVEREILSSDLVAVFRRLATSWGDQMTAVLANALQAVLERVEAPTLLELRRFLADREYRTNELARLRDPYVGSFWRDEFPLLKGHPQAPILTRLDAFLRSRLVRRVVAQPNGIDLRGLLDSGGVLLAKLAQGAIGGENAALLGSLLVSSIHRAALSRIDELPEERRPFFLYLDEFHEVATPSMATLFTGARKFRLAVTVAHQDLYQLRAKVPEVERAVLGNAETRIVFRVGEEDARTLARGFSYFTEDDLLSLTVGEAVCRVGGRENDFNLLTAPPQPVDPEDARGRCQAVETKMCERFPVETEPPLPEPPTATAPETEPDATEPVVPPPAGPASQSEATSTPRPARRPEPMRPGRGGAEHTYLQELVKRFAEERGFRASIEEVLPSGGRVDVVLERDGLRLACEIAVGSTVEQEVGNLRKCLAGGFDQVAVLSRSEKLLRSVARLLRDELTAEESQRVFMMLPEAFLAYLSEIPRAVKDGETLGWKVRTTHRLGGVAGVERGEALAKVIARSLNRLKGKPGPTKVR